MGKGETTRSARHLLEKEAQGAVVSHGRPGGHLPRATGVVGLLLLIGLAAILEERAADVPFLQSELASAAGLVIDSMTLGVALICIAAAGFSHDTRQGPSNLATVAVLCLLALAILPVEIASLADNNVGSSLAIGGRGVLCGVVILALMCRQPRMANFRSILTATTAGVAVVAPITWILVSVSDSSASFISTTLRLTSALILLVALGLGAMALRTGGSRALVLALVLVGIAIADSTTSMVGAITLATAVGKGLRFVVVAAMLIAILVELVESENRQREVSALLEAESRLAAQRLQRQLDHKERFVHDAGNALVAIEGGVRCVANGQEALKAAVTSELDRLRTMLTEEASASLTQTFELGAAIRPMVECYRAADTDLHFEANGPVYVRGSATVAAEVTQNLIENSLRHGDGTVAVWVLDNGETGEVRVGDRGTGVALEMQGTLFEHGHSGCDGSGVGLSISKRLIERYNGSISVEDRLGGGSVFSFRLPTPRSGKSPLTEDRLGSVDILDLAAQ